MVRAAAGMIRELAKAIRTARMGGGDVWAVLSGHSRHDTPRQWDFGEGIIAQVWEINAGSVPRSSYAKVSFLFRYNNRHYKWSINLDFGVRVVIATYTGGVMKEIIGDRRTVHVLDIPGNPKRKVAVAMEQALEFYNLAPEVIDL